jgi:TolA-binding protein
MSNQPTFRRYWKSVSIVTLALAIAGPVAVPAAAQDTIAEKRIRKMEAEIRALQRKVFPGDSKMFTPEIAQGQEAAAAAGQPATSAVTDLLRRMDALEAQVARLTGQVEQNTNRIAQLEAGAGGPVGGVATPAAPTATATPVATPAPAPTPTPTPTPAATANLDRMTGGASAAPQPAATPSSARVEAVKAIVKPQTDDTADDEYSYGFRLWEAKFYPEAQQQLAMFVDKYPSHWRASWGRNLLGRAYLDDGKPTEAAKWFLQNYQADKRGGRAPDSLLYLGISMKQLKDTKRACIALAEFSETYAAEAAGRLKGLYDRTRNGLDCG